MKKAHRLLIYLSATATAVVGLMIIWHAGLYMFHTGHTKNGVVFFTGMIGLSVTMTGVNTMLCRRPEK